MKCCIIFTGIFLLCKQTIFVTPKSISRHQNPENEILCRTKQDYITSADCVKDTLKNMGYYKPSRHLDDYHQAIKDYQIFYKLKITGKITDETAELLSQDGCGVPDVIPDPHFMKRLKRQVLAFTSYWHTLRLPWCISRYSRDLPIKDQEDAIQWSLQKWAEHSQLTFPRVSNCGRAIIEIKWATGHHNDFNDFDGKGGTLAHAILPIFRFIRLAGDIHFDDDETWSAALQPETDDHTLIKPIAVHELGHSLGFKHSPDRRSIMFKYYRSNSDSSLHESDIELLQRVYGAPPDTENEDFPPLNVCDDAPVIEAVAMLGDGVTYAFSGPYYWRIGRYGLMDNQTLLLENSRWTDTGGNKLRGDFDAVIFIPLEDCTPTCIGNTYFIRGNKVWEILLNDGTHGTARMKYLNEVFPQAPVHINGALLWRFNMDSTRYLHIYLIKGNEYFRTGNNGPPYRVISQSQVDDLWEQGWKEGNYQAALFDWDYDADDDSVTLRNCFFQDSYYGCYTGASKQLDEGFPKEVKYWYSCDGYHDNTDGDESGEGEDTSDEVDDQNPEGDDDDGGDEGNDNEPNNDAEQNDNDNENADDNNDNTDNDNDNTNNDENNDGDAGPHDGDGDTGPNGGVRHDPEQPSTPLVCEYLPAVQAVTLMGDGLIYAFSGPYYWRMSHNGESDRNLKLITSNWRGDGLEGNFDAVVFRPSTECNPTCTGTTYFFQRNKVFILENSDGSGGDLHWFYQGVFPRLPYNIDGATIVSSDKCDTCFNLYFIKGDSHYTATATHSISPWRPYDVRRTWSNIDIEWTSVDAVFYPRNENDSTQYYYIFKDNEYIKYNADSKTVEHGYPRPQSSWYGC